MAGERFPLTPMPSYKTERSHIFCSRPLEQAMLFSLVRLLLTFSTDTLTKFGEQKISFYKFSYKPFSLT